MGRVFFLASHKCAGASGGGHGVVFRLYQAEKQYHLFDKEVVYVFGDRVICGNDVLGEYQEQKDARKQSDFRVGIKKYIPSCVRILKMENRFRNLSGYLDTIDEKYHFSEDDIYIFHDFRIAYVFLRKYSFTKCSYVHHMQGSIYFEWQAETGIRSAMMQRYYNKLFRSILTKVKYLCFPSKGTEESLNDSEPATADLVAAAEKKYLYNGVKCPEVDIAKAATWVKEIDAMQGYKFATVANLNAAKAVERIPQYLGAIKKAGIPFKWILVGNGVKATEVESEIQKYGLQENVIWKRNGVPHDELMELLSVTDFYILLHKYSIFDLSTLEAMHYGNIPILTPVGGNKEVIIEDNGVFVSDFESAEGFLSIIQMDKVTEMKKKNIEIQNQHFDDKAFLQRYKDLCNQF